MIHPKQARQLVLDQVEPLAHRELPIVAARGCRLARELRASTTLPPYDVSAMDGFAVGPPAPGAPAAALQIIGEATVGEAFGGQVGPGEAVRISTGGRVPQGAVGIVPIERATIAEPDRVQIEGAVDPGAFIRRCGEELSPGDLLLGEGELLGPAAIGMLGALGLSAVEVTPRPRVAVLITGEEFARGPGTTGPSRDANGPLLLASLHALDLHEVTLSHIGDDPVALSRALQGAVEGADVVITTGGASVGPHDHLATAWEQVGVQALFHRVAMKPGKPTHAGVVQGADRRALVFGLPGNPLAVLTAFELLIEPALRRLAGASAASGGLVQAVLAADLPRTWRAQFVRFVLQEASERPVAAPHPSQGSGMLRGAAVSPWVSCVEPGQGVLPAGSLIWLGPSAGQAWESPR